MPLDGPFSQPVRSPLRDLLRISGRVEEREAQPRGSSAVPVISLVSHNQKDRRILVIELFGEAELEATGAKDGRKLNIHGRLDQVSMNAGSLDQKEISIIGRIVKALDEGCPVVSDGNAETRRITIQCFRDAEYIAGQRVYRPEWLFTMPFSARDGITPTHVSNALMAFLTAIKPVPPLQ